MPRLAVLLSTYNRPERLRAAIKGVLRQTYQDLQLVVLDDASTLSAQEDVMAEAVRAGGAQLPVTVISGRGMDKTRTCTFGALINAGLHATDSEFVTYLCDSAVYLPNRCERLVAHLQATPEAALAWDQQHWYRLGAQGQVVEEVLRLEAPNKVETWQGRVWVDRLGQANSVDHNSVMERRSACGSIPWSRKLEDWAYLDWRRWQALAAVGLRFDMLGWLGEEKRCGPDSTGWMVGGGKSLEEVIAARGKL